MRAWWLAAVVVPLIGACTADNIDRAYTAVTAERATVPQAPDYLAPTPPQIRDVPAQYVNCIRSRQAAPEYDVLWGKLFFPGAPPAAGLTSKAKAGTDAQWAVTRWELDRKDCVVLLDPYIAYFAHSDTSITRRFQNLQDAIRTAHIELGHGRIGYGQAVSSVRAVEREFWERAAREYRSMAGVLTPAWLDALPAM